MVVRHLQFTKYVGMPQQTNVCNKFIVKMVFSSVRRTVLCASFKLLIYLWDTMIWNTIQHRTRLSLMKRQQVGGRSVGVRRRFANVCTNPSAQTLEAQMNTDSGDWCWWLVLCVGVCVGGYACHSNTQWNLIIYRCAYCTMKRTNSLRYRFSFYLICVRACVWGRVGLDRWHSRAQWSTENRETFGITAKALIAPRVCGISTIGRM